MRNHPIVDVHTHLFNSRYLPLKHVVKARMWTGWKQAPLTLLANGLGLTDAAAALLASRTPETEDEAAAQLVLIRKYLKSHPEAGESDEPDRVSDVRLFHAIAHSPAHPIKVVPPFSQRWLGKLDSRGTPDDMGPLEYLSYQAFNETFLVDHIARWFIHEPDKEKPSEGNVAAFAIGMMSSEKAIQARINRLFPSVDLFVYQNMDLVPSFYGGITHTYAYGDDNPPDIRTAGNKPVKRIAAAPRIRQMREDSDGRVISFVAWNPFRSLNASISSLEVVKREIRLGASGVKFYPPLGYRAAENDFTGYKKPFFFSEARRQWNNRYLGHKPVVFGEKRRLRERAREVDRVNEELFAWCEANDIPSKVMYGTDFFMPVSASPKDYLEGFEHLFSLPGMQPYKARFFSGNAMKYLKRRVTDRFSSPPQQRSYQSVKGASTP